VNQGRGYPLLGMLDHVPCFTVAYIQRKSLDEPSEKIYYVFYCVLVISWICWSVMT
jgi:hypothetical protein